MVGAAGAARAAVEVEWVQLAGRAYGYGSWMPEFYLEDVSLILAKICFVIE